MSYCVSYLVLLHNTLFCELCALVQEVEKFLDSYQLHKNHTVLLDDKLARKDALPPVVGMRDLFTQVT